MKKELIEQLHADFEGAAHHKEDVEYWQAREFQHQLGHTTWRRFEETIERARTACTTAGQRVEDHFAEAGKMVEIALVEGHA